MVDYAVVGRLSVDYIVTADDQVHEEMLGGGAAYSAAGARLWSSSVGLVSRIGANFPEEHLRALRNCGVDLSNLQRSELKLTHRTFFAYESPTIRTDGKPTSHFLRVGKPLPKSLLDFDPEEDPRSREDLDPDPERVTLNGADFTAVHLAPLSWRRANLISARIRDRGVPLITLDPDSAYIRPGEYEQLKLLLHNVDAFLPSASQAEVLFRPKPKNVNELEMLETFGSWGPRFIVLKRGASGQVVYDRDQRKAWEVPAYPTQPHDVTGAGHAFCGGFLVGLGETGDPREATLRGSVAASMAIEGMGPLYPLKALRGLAAARLEYLRSACQERSL